MANYLRTANHSQRPPTPPSTLPNGASASHSNSATPSTNPPHPQSGAGASSTADSLWPRQSPGRPAEPVVRPVQQIMQSPVDKWGLKGLLYEIKTQMGKGDRGMLMFGEELSDVGVDVAGEEWGHLCLIRTELRSGCAVLFSQLSLHLGQKPHKYLNLYELRSHTTFPNAIMSMPHPSKRNCPISRKIRSSTPSTRHLRISCNSRRRKSCAAILLLTESC